MSYTTTINVNDGTTTSLWDVQADVVSIDPESGVATITLTPRGGFARLPAPAEGPPGLPSPPRNVIVNLIASGATPATPVVSIINPGGPGVAAIWDLTIEVNKGAAGAAGTSTVLGAVDLTGSVVGGYQLTAVVPVSGSVTQVQFTPIKVGAVLRCDSPSTTSGSTSPRTLASITVPAQLFDWRPRCFGQVIVGGASDGSTRVDLEARLGSTGGDVVGYGYGVAGTSPPPTLIIPANGAPLSGSYGMVAAGVGPTVVLLRGVQKASSTQAWTTNASTTTFEVEVKPIP